MKWCVGQVVRFKKNHKGYFAYLGQTPLTISKVYSSSESGGDGLRVRVKEIDEIHLINPCWLEVVDLKRLGRD
jgi:hypothetical protein